MKVFNVVKCFKVYHEIQRPRRSRRRLNSHLALCDKRHYVKNIFRNLKLKFYHNLNKLNGMNGQPENYIKTGMINKITTKNAHVGNILKHYLI